MFTIFNIYLGITNNYMTTWLYDYIYETTGNIKKLNSEMKIFHNTKFCYTTLHSKILVFESVVFNWALIFHYYGSNF